MALTNAEATQLATIAAGIAYLTGEVGELKESITTIHHKLYGLPEQLNGGMVGQVRKNTTFRENTKSIIKTFAWVCGLSGGTFGGYLGLSELIKLLGK